MYIILLTACINPMGMPFTKVTNKHVRLQQYREALDFYLANTRYPIVFAENSNTDISQYYQEYIRTGRLECLTFSGNDTKSKGKGYGEANIIEYTLANSQLIHNDCRIIKITGRLIVENIKTLIETHFPLQNQNAVICALNSELSYADSRIFIAPVGFLKTFLTQKEFICDQENVFFEHILAKCLLNYHFPFAPFWIEPSIVGISGSTGEVYHSTLTSTRLCAYRLMSLYRYKSFNNLTTTRHSLKDAFYLLLRIYYKLSSRTPGHLGT